MKNNFRFCKLLLIIIALVQFSSNLFSQENIRLLAVAYADEVGNTDSLSFVWSGNRHGVTYSDALPFDTSFRWNEANGTFFRQINTFDAYNNIITTKGQHYNGATAWINEQDVTTTYNQDNLPLQSETNYWQNNEISEVSRITYSYDGQNRFLSLLWENGPLDDVQNNSFSHYSYGTNEGPDEIIVESWSELGNEWITSDRISYTYDASGNSVLQLNELWNVGLNEFWNNYRFLSVYNTDNNLIEYTTELWDNVNETFTPLNRYIYLYNSDGKLEESIRQNYDELDEEFTNSFKETSAYSYGLLMSTTPQNWENGDWADPAEEYIINFYYDFVPTAIQDQSGISEISIYPNPTSETLLVNYSGNINWPVILEIIDQSGKKVLTREILNQLTEIAVKDLAPGIYFVRLNNLTKIFIKN